MASDWIIIAALSVLAVGVILYFKSTALDAPERTGLDPNRIKPASKGAVRPH